MRRASYREAVQWIADNDSAGQDDALDLVCVSELITTVLIGDLFNVEYERVARDVIRSRQRRSARRAELLDRPFSAEESILFDGPRVEVVVPREEQT